MVHPTILRALGLLATLSLPLTTIAANATAGCRKLSSDSDWPTKAQWEAALPGVIPKKASLLGGSTEPDYRYRVKDAEGVQRAIKFAKENNIRVSVVASGHELLGRSSAASGLLIDISFLNGVNVLQSYTPTPKGVPSVSAGQTANVITPKAGVQAAATVGGGTPGQFLNNALSKSKLFAIGGAHGTIFPFANAKSLN
jgi:FAD/FMN-containing dehydrogenase